MNMVVLKELKWDIISDILIQPRKLEMIIIGSFGGCLFLSTNW